MIQPEYPPLMQPFDGASQPARHPVGQIRYSVCVATYKRPKGFVRTLESLRPQIEGKPDRELIVLNDGSHDAAYEQALAKLGDWFRYVNLAKNAGIAAARNRLAQEARGVYILYTDDDCVTPEYWLDWAVAALDVNPDLDVLAGISRGLFEGREGLLARTWAHYGFLPWPHFTSDFQRFVTACLAVRRETLLASGGFRIHPDWHHVGEDTDLSRRLVQAGARMRLDTDWFVYHDLNDTWAKQLRRFWSYGYASAAMNHLTTNPALHENVLWVSRKDHWSHLRTKWLEAWSRSRSFSRWPLPRAMSAAIATSIHMSYRDGVATAAKRNRQVLGL